MQEGDLSQKPVAASAVGPISQTPGHVPTGQNYRRGNGGTGAYETAEEDDRSNTVTPN